MGTTLHSFIDIFETEFDVSGETIQLKKIAIPLIQRDYAQGRLDADVNRVRSRFLASLYDAVTKEPITLDFVYGDIDAKGTMTPLDGQQRLTTLYLLHWYAAKKENVPAERYVFLNKFSYETRYSARYFCAELVDFTPAFTDKISKEIIDQAWFPLDWKKDPTIGSMLVMLDAIDERFKDVPDLWDKLRNRAITFYFLPIKDMGLTDELYIKMNSRGKPLTLFEHFKAELEREIRSIDEKAAERVIGKIDRTWTDLLWRYRNGNSGNANDNIIDDEFLHYFKFICDIICYRKGLSPQGFSNDEFDLLQRYFAASNEDTLVNIKTLEAFFDCWCGIDGYDSPADFLNSFMSGSHEDGKIVVDKNNIDIFEDCIHSYSDKSGRVRQFPLNRIVLLYAITVYLQNQKTVSVKEFTRRIRIVNNLIQNSEDEVSDRLDRNRIPAILRAIDSIILKGKIDDSIENSFNVNQLQEEREKILFLSENPACATKLFLLEDHPLLRGQVGIVGLENLAYADRFASLFSCSWDLIDCALMTIGNYGQQERNKWRFQYASKNNQLAWTELFHKNANSGFDNTKAILLQLLKTNEAFSNDVLADMVSTYIAQCEADGRYPWNYYYVKYPIFRPGSFGKLSNTQPREKPYCFSVMKTRSQWSQNTYMPYLKSADDAHLSKDSLGQRLVYPSCHIICDNAAYLIRSNEDESVMESLEIQQDADGIDTEDRIIKLKQYLRKRQL